MAFVAAGDSNPDAVYRTYLAHLDFKNRHT